MNGLSTMPNTLTIRTPDDGHLHLRDGAFLASVLPHTCERFARAVVMPNLDPPLTAVEQVLNYRKRILDLCPASATFEPWMTLYLHVGTRPQDIIQSAEEPSIVGAKLYPQGVTTGAASNVTDPLRLLPVFEAMAQSGMPLLVHAEDPDPATDPFEREARFIEKALMPLCRALPGLRIVFEHVTTRLGVEFVRSEARRMAATITVHHLLFDRRALFAGGLRPHLYCLPLPKSEVDQKALLEAATGGEPSFFLGTDSAPHPRSRKECACSAAGIYSAHAAIELYAEVFEAAGRLERLEAFASQFAAEFYGKPLNSGRITLERDPWQVPDHFAFAGEELVPLRAGGRVAWRLTRRATEV
ncbi:MAG: dihydroorotase [Gammaproteobacteria bacterium]